MKSSCRPSPRALDRRGVEHEAGRARRRDDDVGARELPSLERSRADGRVLLFAVSTISAPRVRRLRAACSPTLPAPISRIRQPVEIAEHLLGERGGRRRDRRGALADRRLRAHLAAGVQRLAEDAVEQRPGRARLVGGAHLAEDLALARHERVEPGRDAEEMERGSLVAQAVERGLDLRLELGERRDRALLGLVGVLRDDVELGAVARREADGLAELARRARAACSRSSATRSRSSTGA